MENDKKYIYILTNKSFDNYVKVGFTDDIELKINELNDNAITPFPFELYATYEVNSKDVAVKILDVLNILSQCFEDNAVNKKSDEMFINASPEKVYVLFKAIAQIDNNENDVVRHEKQPEVTIDVIRDEIVDKMIINEAIKLVMRKTGFTQKELGKKVGIPTQQQIGSSLTIKNMTFDKAIKYLDVLGYDLVLKPKNANHLEDEIIITSSKKDNY